jgi:hypothetical protein
MIMSTKTSPNLAALVVSRWNHTAKCIQNETPNRAARKREAARTDVGEEGETRLIDYLNGIA